MNRSELTGSQDPHAVNKSHNGNGGGGTKSTRRPPANSKILPGKRRVASLTNGSSRRLNFLDSNEPLHRPHNYAQAVVETVAPVCDYSPYWRNGVYVGVGVPRVGIRIGR